MSTYHLTPVVFTGAVSYSWRRLGKQIALVAWPAPERLLILDQESRVAVSSDGGRSFRPAGDVPGQPVAFMATGSELYVALADNRILRSADGGATWAFGRRSEFGGSPLSVCVSGLI